MLIAELNGARIAADVAERRSDYTCPICHKAAILKRGDIRIAHFAHKPPKNCIAAKGETIAHMMAKVLLREVARQRGLRAEYEFIVDGLPGDRRADVMVWSPANAAAAIELQHTPLGLGEIQSRTAAYIAAGIAVAWLPFLTRDDLDRGRAGGGDSLGDWVIPRYVPRVWQCWAHGFGLGQLAYYAPDDQKIWIGRFAPHEIEISSHSWFTSEGDEESTGGHSRKSLRWRELQLTGPFRPEDTRIKRVPRKQDTVGEYLFPAGLVARLEPIEGAIKQPFSSLQMSLEQTGRRVFHGRFGYGTVVEPEYDDNDPSVLVVVDFVRAGRKRVIRSFLKTV